MVLHSGILFVSLTSFWKADLALKLVLISCLFIGVSADGFRHLCISPAPNVEWQRKECSLEEKGFGILIHKVRLSSKPRTSSESESDCSDLYDDDKTEDVTPQLQQMLENVCNGLGRCTFDRCPIESQDYKWTYIVSYKCVRVVPKQSPADVNKPVFDMLRNYTEVHVKGTAVLSMRASGLNLPVNRTCYASGASEPFTVKILHLDLIGDQNLTSCFGLMNITSGSYAVSSVNCSQSESRSYYKKKKDAPDGKGLTLSISMLQGFVWLKIDTNKSSFVISCNGTSTSEGQRTIGPQPNNKSIPFPVRVTKEPHIQPEPGKTYGTRSTTTTFVSTTTTTTTVAKSAPNDATGSNTIVVAVVSAIAGVATTVAIVLAIYLCKSRASPYQRWRQKRQSRLNVPAIPEGGNNTRPNQRHHANRRNDEYAFVEPSDIRRSNNTISPAGGDSGMYDTADDSSPPPALPPSPRPIPSPDKAQHVYVNEEKPQAPTGAQGMMYSQVVMTNSKDSGVKIYAPGFYHTARKKEPSPPPGGDPYDVMGSASGQYMHLRDATTKPSYLPSNVYDG